MKIMIADDELRLRKVVAMFLKKQGHDIFEYSDAEQVLDSITEVSPDVIVLDVNMPGIGGIEGCRQIKLNSEFKHIPVIMLTANAAEDEKDKGLKAGADAYITKPFSPKDLLEQISLLNERQ